MTDLEKRAKAFIDEKNEGTDGFWATKYYLHEMLIEFAQQETELLSRHILELQADKGRLIDRVKELEAQIEKMKCCENCAWWYRLPNGQKDCAEHCENLDNWSLRR